MFDPRQKVLADVYEFLLRASEYLEDHADVRDGADGQPVANTAMQLGSELEGNDYERGLIARVKAFL